MASANKEDASPQRVSDGKFPIVLIKEGVIGKIVDGVDAYTCKKGLFQGGGFQEKMGETQVDDDSTDVTDMKG